MKPQIVRFAIVAGILALALICLTVLGALGAVPGEKVLDILAAAIPAFAGGMLGARANGNAAPSLRPPVVAPYPRERP